MGRKYKKGLLAGRMQPVTLGHVSLVANGLEECDFLQVILGSIQEFRTNKNIFTFGERVEMLDNCFRKECLEGRLSILGAADINNYPKWSSYMLGLADKDTEVYYAGSEEDIRPFTEYPVKGFENLKIKILDRNLTSCLSGTQVRELLINKDELWKTHTPKENWEILQRIDYEKMVPNNVDV